MNNKILLLDFEDSFTYNLVEVLQRLDLCCDVILWKDFKQKHLDQYQAFIFGPGPGHPSEYKDCISWISEIEKNDKFFLGICLGHQLFWYSKNQEIIRVEPKHGISESIITEGTFLQSLVEDRNVNVQYYNSLAVKVDQSDFVDNWCYVDDILIASYGSHFCTYQFHPESIGTSCPEGLFTPLKRFLV